MALKTFKTVTRNITTLRKGLREDIYGADISDVKVVVLTSDASSEEGEIGIAEFVRSVRSMPDDENIILTAIAF